MTAPAQEPGPRPLAAERPRLAFLVRVAASAGQFSRKLGDAIDEATDAEVRIMSDLVERGMSIPALVSFLQGAHVIVGDDGLYHRWIFQDSHERLSSHHKDVDKQATPDYGLEGPLVVEALYGRVSMGTWIQLERTATSFQWGQHLTWKDMGHIRDFLVYRMTGKNVGPWGLSAHVDTRPIVLRPAQATIGRGASSGLAELARRRAGQHGTAQEQESWSAVLSPQVPRIGPAGELFAPPAPDSPEDLLPDRPYGDDLGLGLFGALTIMQSSATLGEGVAATLDAPRPPVRLAPITGTGTDIAVPMGKQALRVRATVLPERTARSTFLGLEEDPT